MDMSTSTSSGMDMSSTTSSMAMAATGTAVNITNLPITDPRCNNLTCTAFMDGYTASQAQIPWASQFAYGQYATYYWIICVLIFGLFYLSKRLGSGHVFSPAPTTTMAQKIRAVGRSLSYRRCGIGMSLGTAAFLLLATIFLFALTFAQRPYYRLHRGYGSPPLGVRAGMIAFALTPLTVALAGKYNLITLITGISHEKLNILHRYVAYMTLVASIIHTVPFIVNPLQDPFGGPKLLAMQFMYALGATEYTGIPPFALLVFLSVFSVPWIRHRFYEIFVHSHIAGSIVYLGLLFWHAAKTEDSWTYLWATVAIWLLSLFGRVVGKMNTPIFGGLQATLEDVDGEMIKLSVPACDGLNWTPGQHVFLRFPTLAPLDNAPFTIASTCDETYVLDKTGRTSRKPLIFLIKPEKGITKKLASIAQSQDRSPKTLKVVLEGPYGGLNESLENAYEQIILVAGGSGITAILPQLTHLSRKLARKDTVLQQIRLIWACKCKHATEWFQDELKEAIDAAGARLTIDYYVTSENAKDVAGRCCSASGKEDVEAAARSVERENDEIVRVHTKGHDFGPGLYGRPVLAQLIPTAIQGPRTCVIGCGPKGMNEDLSNAVAACQSLISVGGEVQEVALHTETFGW